MNTLFPIAPPDVPRQITANARRRRAWAVRVLVGLLEGLADPDDQWRGVENAAGVMADRIGGRLAPICHREDYSSVNLWQLLRQYNRMHARAILDEVDRLIQEKEAAQCPAI